MRLTRKEADFIKSRILAVDPDAEIYLFGSRADDSQKGGDIDVLILTEERLPRSALRSIKLDFYSQFGYQKLDLINFLFQEDLPFKKLAMLEAARL